jgi:NADPH:quinone reductase-like Zn-dependent oxidoreductase
MSAVASRTIRFHQYGEPADVLREEHTEIPDPPTARIRVRVAAVGLNPADWELSRGFMGGNLPRGIGLDVAGTVDAVGEGVADVQIGDLVFGVPDFLGQPSAGAADVAIMRNWAIVPTGLGVIEASVHSCRSTRSSRPTARSAYRSHGPIPSPTGAKLWR